MLEIRDLEVVQAIIIHRSFARAARVLGISQPTLTRQIAALEQQLRGPLFVRGSHGVQETDLCRVLMGEAADLLGRFRALEARLGLARGEHGEDLTIATGSYAAETVGMQALAHMLAKHRAIQLRFSVLNWTQAIARLRDREAELALVEMTELGEEPDLVVEPMRRHPSAFAARAGHPLAGRRGLALADIFAFPICFIGRVPDRVMQPFAAARENAQRMGRIHPVFPAAIVESAATALLAVCRSDAVVPVNGPLAEIWMRSGSITMLPWHEPWATTAFGIVYLRARPPSEAAQAFIDCVHAADREAEAGDAAFLSSLNIMKF